MSKLSDDVDELVAKCESYEPHTTRRNLAAMRLGIMIDELRTERDALKAEESQWEVERVGLLAEVAGLKSQGPFTVDENSMVFCEDTGVYLNPHFPQGIADKLNALQALVKRHEAALKWLHMNEYTIDSSGKGYYLVRTLTYEFDGAVMPTHDTPLAAIEAAKEAKP